VTDVRGEEANDRVNELKALAAQSSSDDSAIAGEDDLHNQVEPAQNWMPATQVRSSHVSLDGLHLSFKQATRKPDCQRGELGPLIRRGHAASA
jgi:hypothetical protein